MTRRNERGGGKGERGEWNGSADSASHPFYSKNSRRKMTLWERLFSFRTEGGEGTNRKKSSFCRS